MQKTNLTLDAIKLMGIKTRTNNQHELNSSQGKINECVEQYFQYELFAKIPHLKNPGVTFCVYTEYESDHNGEYTFFIGEEVTEIDLVPEELTTLIIPAQKYAKLTTEPGPMPKVVIDAWQEIWQMSEENLGGARSYRADFEVYDERATNQFKTVLDIYIGIK